MPFTTEVANQIIDQILNGVTFSPPGVLFVSLHTNDPGDTGVNELSGGDSSGGYTRQGPISWSTAANKHSDNDSLLEFTDLPAATITHVGLWTDSGVDSSSATEFWWGGSLNSSKTVNDGDTLQIQAGDLNVDLT